MIDAKTLPPVDISGSVDVLRQYAIDNFGKKISPNYKDETVRSRFAQIYFEETGTQIAGFDQIPPVGDSTAGDEDDAAQYPVGPDPNAAVVQDPFGTEVQAPPLKPEPTAATIVLQDDPNDSQPVCGSVNYVSYRIMRNTPVRVSMPILNSLKAAVKTVYPNPETMEPKEAYTYNFSILEFHYD